MYIIPLLIDSFISRRYRFNSASCAAISRSQYSASLSLNVLFSAWFLICSGVFILVFSWLTFLSPRAPIKYFQRYVPLIILTPCFRDFFAGALQRHRLANALL